MKNPQEEPKQEPLSFPPFDKEKADVITKEGQKVIRELRSNIQQETLEEAAERLYPISKGGSMWMPSADDCNKANKQEGFIQGAKWQEERMYSEEEVKRICSKAWLKTPNTPNMLEEFDKWFEQFKKK
jgi:hypothetical protein